MRKLDLAVMIATTLLPSMALCCEEGVAWLVEIHGNVLVSRDFEMASAVSRARLAPGERVLVTANSAAVVEYDGGCRVDVGPEERHEVREPPGCRDRARESKSRVAEKQR